MAVLVGIDEAGYGPILGPLVVSATTFSVPDPLLQANMWDFLRKSVSMTRKNLIGRLLIADSKKAHTPTSKTKHLERTTLAALNCIGKEIHTAGQLITQICPDHLQRLQKHNWYATLENRELGFNKADIAIAGNVFKADMESNGIKLLDIESRCLDAGYYNEMVEKVKNKATVLFSSICQLINETFIKYGAHNDLQIIVDRQGGKTHYVQSLQRMFGQMELKILKETPATSSYELTGEGRKMRIHFVVKADSRFLPVSLSSMVSKYLRELLMDEINRYFAGFCADLKPTAGYWEDGLRFLADIKRFGIEDLYDKAMFVRSR